MTTLKKYYVSILLGVVIGIGFALSFGLGFVVSSFTLDIDTIKSGEPSQYPILAEVQRLLDHIYLRDLPEQESLEYAAIRGMLTTLNDPTTLFIEPPVAQSEAHALAGTYGGIGVQVRRIESGEFALYPFEDGPAYEQGIRDHDILMQVNDLEITSDIQIDVVDQLLRGEVIDENGVEIIVKRGQEELVEAFVAFEVINVPSVISRITTEDERIGYMQILRFTSRSPEELRSALKSLVDEGVSAIVLDLRNNSGGLLIESIAVADQFISGGTIVIENTRDSRKVYDANNESIDDDILVVVLVNGRTASAAELVAGALQDNGRGILVGQQTYGKGTVQQIFPLSDGSSVHITSAEWLTPNEHVIAENGLTPDILMIPDENGRDVEFGEAIRYLKSILDKQAK